MTSPTTPPLPSGDDLSVRLGELLAKAEIGTLKHVYMGGTSTILDDTKHRWGCQFQYADKGYCIGEPFTYHPHGDANGEPAELRHDFVVFRHDIAALIVEAVNALPQILAEHAALNARVEEARGVMKRIEAIGQRHVSGEGAALQMLRAARAYLTKETSDG